MKKLVIVIMIAMLFVAEGCVLDSNISRSKLDKFCQNNLNKFLQQERSIGAIGRYNYNNLTSPFRIGNVPNTQFEWQQWNMMNSKLGKYLAR